MTLKNILSLDNEKRRENIMRKLMITRFRLVGERRSKEPNLYLINEYTKELGWETEVAKKLGIDISVYEQLIGRKYLI